MSLPAANVPHVPQPACHTSSSGITFTLMRSAQTRYWADLNALQFHYFTGRKVSSMRLGDALERMKVILLDPSLGYGKQMLRFLVQNTRFEAGQVTLRGSVGQLEKAGAHRRQCGKAGRRSQA